MSRINSARSRSPGGRPSRAVASRARAKAGGSLRSASANRRSRSAATPGAASVETELIDKGGDLLDDRLGGCIDLVDQSRQPRPIGWIELELLPLHVGDEFRIDHRGVERVAQHFQRLGRQVRRRRERTPDPLSGIEEVDGGALIFVTGKIASERNASKLRARLRRALEQD